MLRLPRLHASPLQLGEGVVTPGMMTHLPLILPLRKLLYKTSVRLLLHDACSVVSGWILYILGKGGTTGWGEG